ncbi:ABC transporter permease [Hansschlegelia plantiphila]|uniref:Spermidine/putrescine ABC transporter permease n=1 Tax=Hansschlegelia plantiphila TaxID=374655 RepID=A0A9W6MWI0_9HYPH|nr:ABC transporter permease [Hansschlegelia plantiphila]GLK69041.1 spermidine/putrescine ABC transporter permease [Hansschlegelia plantiphila]
MGDGFGSRAFRFSSRHVVTVLLLAPAAAVFFGLFVASLSFFFVQSFWKATTFRVVPDFRPFNYVDVIAGYGGPLLRTLSMGLIVASVTTMTAFFFAYVVRFSLGRFGPAALLVALTTLFGGYLVKIYAWRTILGADGIINSALLNLGLIDAPLPFLLFNLGAVVVTLTYYLLPLAILPLYGALSDIDETELAAARDMGAGALRTILDIVLPQARPALMASFALCFLLAAGDYVTPAMVGSPGNAMFGNFIQSQFGLRMNTPSGAAMSFTLIAACMIVLAAVGSGLRRWLQPR